MAISIKPGTGFPFAISITKETDLGPNHTWGSVADWCTMLIGPMDEWWSIEWDDSRGMVWGFTRKVVDNAQGTNAGTVISGFYPLSKKRSRRAPFFLTKGCGDRSLTTIAARAIMFSCNRGERVV